MMTNRTSSRIVTIVVIVTVAILVFDLIRTIPTRTYDDGKGNLVIGMVMCRRTIPLDSIEMLQFPQGAYSHCVRTNGTTLFNINSGHFYSNAMGNFLEYTNSRKSRVLFSYKNEKYVVNDWRESANQTN